MAAAACPDLARQRGAQLALGLERGGVLGGAVRGGVGRLRRRGASRGEGSASVGRTETTLSRVKKGVYYS